MQTTQKGVPQACARDKESKDLHTKGVPQACARDKESVAGRPVTHEGLGLQLPNWHLHKVTPPNRTLQTTSITKSQQHSEAALAGNLQRRRAVGNGQLQHGQQVAVAVRVRGGVALAVIGRGRALAPAAATDAVTKCLGPSAATKARSPAKQTPTECWRERGDCISQMKGMPRTKSSRSRHHHPLQAR